jgi:hypothetical protein
LWIDGAAEYAPTAKTRSVISQPKRYGITLINAQPSHKKEHCRHLSIMVELLFLPYRSVFILVVYMKLVLSGVCAADSLLFRAITPISFDEKKLRLPSSPFHYSFSFLTTDFLGLFT